MKKNYILLVISLWASVAAAQQPAQFSLWMLNPYGRNVAAGGLEKTLVATAGYRAQWVGLEGSPTTQYINVSLPISLIGSGVGVAVENENIGARSGLSVKLSYNFIKKLGNGQLSFGVAGGIVQGTLDGAKLRTPDGDYAQNVIDHRDPLLNAVSLTGSVTTFDAGVFYKNDKLEIGISSGNLTEPKLRLENQKVAEVRLRRHYTAMAIGHFDLFSSISVHPSVLIKSDGTETQMDFSAMFRYADNFFLGATFRGYNASSQDAAVIYAGFKLSPNLNLAYAYDVTLSALKSASQGSHEVLLQYNFGKEFGRGRLPPIIYNPRF